MAELTRQVGNIGVAEYIAPGVSNNIAQGLATVAQAGLDIDQRVAENALKGELENMRALYESGSRALTGDEGMDQISRADMQEVFTEQNRLQKLARAMEQGGISIDRYRLYGEAALRAAMARRPDLSAEFRQLASDTLGVDVGGAGIELLASAERQMDEDRARQATTQAQAYANAGKNARRYLEGSTNPALLRFARMADGDLGRALAEDPLVQAAFDSHLTSVRMAEEAKRQAEFANNNVTAQRAADTAAASARVSGFDSVFYGGLSIVNDALKDNLIDESELAQLNSTLQAAMIQATTMKAELNGVDMDESARTRNISILDERVAQLKMAIETAKTNPEEAAKLLVAQAKLGALRDPTVLLNTATVELFGPTIGAQVLAGKTQEQTDALTVSITNAVNENLPPKEVAGALPHTIDGIIDNINRAKGDMTEQARASNVKLLYNGIKASVDTPIDQYQHSTFTGNTGVLVRLAGPQGQTLFNLMNTGEKEEFATALLAASRRAFDAVRADIVRNAPRGTITEQQIKLTKDGLVIDGAVSEQVRNSIAPYIARVNTGFKNMITANRTFGRAENDDVVLDRINRTYVAPPPVENQRTVTLTTAEGETIPPEVLEAFVKARNEGRDFNMTVPAPPREGNQ